MDDVWEERDDREYQRREEEAAPAEKMGYEGKAAQAQVSLGDDLWEMHAAAGKLAEFTAGRGLEDYEQSEMLRAVLKSMLGVMAAALSRITVQSAELAGRLAAADLAALVARMNDEAERVQGPEVWRFVEEALPELRVRTQTELEAWHGA